MNKLKKFFFRTEIEFEKFLSVWIFGIIVVSLEAICAYRDGYLTQAQMHDSGLKGYSLFENAGIICDFIIISPAVAWICAHYTILGTRNNLIILLLALVSTIEMSLVYVDIGIRKPEALSHDGYLTLAGWIHSIYLFFSILFFLLFYVGDIRPKFTRGELKLMLVIMTVFIPLSVMKFNPNWEWDTIGIYQVSILLSLVWIISTYKINRLYRRNKY